MLPSNWKDHFVSSESTAERRIAVQRATEERAAVRKRHLDAQASPLIGAEDRIRLWEQLHGLHLPVDPAHRLVRVIAQQTALSVQQIQDEQRRRAMPRDAQPTQATEAASS